MADAPSPQELKRPPARRFFWPGGLSARLLILTVLFVAGAGAMAIPPALAAFEEQWLLDRVRAAELASMATDADPNQVMSEQLASRLRQGAGVQWVAVQKDGNRFLKVPGPRLAHTPYLVDLRDQAPASWLSAPFNTLAGKGADRMVRVIAEPRFYDAEFIEVVAPDAELRGELWRYLWRLLFVMVFVSVFAGGLVYLSLNLFLVRPMQRITRSMERFAADPEDQAARLAPSGRRDEVGRAEIELDRMQSELRAALAARARLAALGEGVAKINHDLRNMLTSAQIASERLAALQDPKVSQALPRLERALDRAVKLASDVLTYGKTQEPAPDLRTFPLQPALEAAAEEARLSGEAASLASQVAPGDQVTADPDQLHRILANLMRNAREAAEQQEGRTAPVVVRVTLEQADGMSLIRLADNGPGVGERARGRLFQPFAGSSRPGGAGLGLAIARELALGHGGDLALVDTGPAGSTFELRLPGAPPSLKTPRRRRAKTEG
jgi:signal transduction histidine kinase